ncbi:hypothetical protein R1sor_008067 [Riccia sorocarpa]|uniref:ATP-dependent RNA helicase n=1 Tax=Riccia sorocarpa TaxID=122646 RepID=A0ABD3HUH3_9MARC
MVIGERDELDHETTPSSPVLPGHDRGLAQTGSGKTGAFALPILPALLEKPQPLFACVLSPTRELAIQIAEQFEALGLGTGVKCAVVGTPGRLVDHLTNTKGFTLVRTTKYLVLDEADRHSVTSPFSILHMREKDTKKGKKGKRKGGQDDDGQDVGGTHGGFRKNKFAKRKS